MDTARVIVDVQALEWMPTGFNGTEVKVLRLNDDFCYIDLYRAKGGLVGPSHVHVGPTEVYFLSGEVETVAGVAGKDHWVLEPAGAMHRASKSFVGERTITDAVSLNHVSGPMAFIGPDGTVPPLVYGQSLKTMMTGDNKRLSGAALTVAMYPENYNSGIVDTRALEWVPSGYDGVSIKVLKVYEHGRFTLIVKAEDGAVTPARHHTAPADFYVLSGCMKFEDQQEAPANFWVYEPMGAAEGPVTHVGETTYLATFVGAALDRTSDGGFKRVFDGQAIHGLLNKVTHGDSAAHA
jgi:hypothetical protein